MSQKRILVVDDEVQIVSVLRDILSRYGYDVATAHDGKQALNSVRDALPDLIILDLVMPELDGWRTCQRLKQQPESAKIPVIVLSGMMTDVDDKTENELGDLYISKPFEIADLLKKIRGLLGEPPK